MQTTLQNPRRWLGLFAFCLLALAAAAGLPASASAGDKTVEIDYYFDAAKTQYAGACVSPCGGVIHCSGTQTAYFTKQIWLC